MEVTIQVPEISDDTACEKDHYTIGGSRLSQFITYIRKVYRLRDHLADITDGRQDPTYSTLLVALAVFFCGLLRIRSFNALEPRLKETGFLKLVGAPSHLSHLGSADTVSRTLQSMNLNSVRNVVVGVLRKAERNKVFREGWIGSYRYVAIDGWEPIQSWNRHCDHCLVRKVKKKDASGKVIEVEQYYHRYVVAMLIDDRMDLALDFEPLLPSDLRPGPLRNKADEGELTAAKRLVRRLRQTYPWVDVVVADALYANGPFLSLLKELDLGGVIIVRKSSDEPLKEALDLWADKPAEQTFEDKAKGERIELWDCKDIETLDTYDGKIRVVRAQVSKADNDTVSTWCACVIGKPGNLSPRQVLRVARGRWHIENTGFHQWTKRWQFAHVFTHDNTGMQALYWLFFSAYDLLTLFLYRQLKSYGRDRAEVTQTISRLIDELRDDLARLFLSPWDTS
ncbi:MAG: transposase [Actinobacteria bacterium]|nr:transposase [Actinomycetota bacterium]